ncbi:hypothetical protein [Gryllotalpicola ginsengisoli]|uniref:hypothetical protein n=1 Tax=Gryllotalpicola ginsengisoli TaxID=444608 RepID=UPI0003B2F24A|nr:hypothetical protein [Gryllotalpicola ginsengisoli]
MSGELVFSDKAAKDISTALGRALAEIADFDLVDPSGSDLGDPTVTSAASELYIGLNAFTQGLSVGVGACQSTVDDANDTIGIFDKQLEAAAPKMAPKGDDKAVTFSNSTDGRTGISVTDLDMGSIGGISAHRNTYRGDTETEHKVETNVVTGDSSETISHTDENGTVTATDESNAYDGESTRTFSHEASDGSSITVTTDGHADGTSHTTVTREPAHHGGEH